jgi:hypothetical protein
METWQSRPFRGNHTAAHRIDPVQPSHGL